jgi:flagellar basal body rod protein FlgG
MNYGLYLSAAGAIASAHRQDVLANNLANINTVGFKPDAVDVRSRLPERAEFPGNVLDAKHLLEQLGGGIYANPTRVELSQGALTRTEGDLDLAIEGDGFFTVQDNSGPEQVRRLTRDGRFTLNSDAELVMAASGHRVLDRLNRPIRLDPGQNVNILKDGRILQNGREVATLGFARPQDPASLIKAGHNLLRLDEGAELDAARPDGAIRQGFTEASAVNAITTLTSMMSAAKSVQSNLKMIQYHDNILGQAFNTFGRVA